jgi:hypothetical protein
MDIKELFIMNNLRKLSDREMEKVIGGEAITLAGVMAILVISIVVVMCYRFFISPKGKVSLPGGFEFEWKN